LNRNPTHVEQTPPMGAFASMAACVSGPQGASGRALPGCRRWEGPPLHTHSFLDHALAPSTWGASVGMRAIQPGVRPDPAVAAHCQMLGCALAGLWGGAVEAPPNAVQRSAVPLPLIVTAWVRARWGPCGLIQMGGLGSAAEVLLPMLRCCTAGLQDGGVCVRGEAQLPAVQGGGGGPEEGALQRCG
jgi:hypothetical protein